MVSFLNMKLSLVLAIFLVYLLGLASCAQQQKNSDSITDKQKWQNVDSELKKGAKKTKGLLHRAGILSDEKETADEPSNDGKSKEDKSEESGPSSALDSRAPSFWSFMRNHLNQGWNRALGFLDGLTDGESSTSSNE
jgi:hypothetical protein